MMKTARFGVSRWQYLTLLGENWSYQENTYCVGESVGRLDFLRSHSGERHGNLLNNFDAEAFKSCYPAWMIGQ